MGFLEKQVNDWSNIFANPPRLTQQQSMAASLLAAVFLVMAILQAASFNDFKDILSSLGLTASSGTWAVIIILSEVWAAIGLLPVRMHGLVHFFSAFFAVFVASFWLVQSLQVIASTRLAEVSSMGFFGKYLTQAPGWWTVVEAGVIFFWTVYVLQLARK